MVKILSSAPGSTMLIGEHAVLRGYKSICCAINHKIKIELTSREDNKVIINSDIANHETNIKNLEYNPKLSFVMECLKSSFLPSGCNISIDSKDIPPDIGFGSSAAIVASLLGALDFWTLGQINQNLIHLKGLDIIRKIQGRGSGADLAASIFGGVVLYNIDPIEINLLPTTKDLTLVYCGYKTPTSKVLEIISKKEKKNPSIYKEIFSQMGDLSEKASNAWYNKNWNKVYEFFEKYNQLMIKMGLNTKEIDEIVKLMKQSGLSGVKISGSGLGDCVIGFGHKKLEKYKSYNTCVAEQGLKVKVL